LSGKIKVHNRGQNRGTMCQRMVTSYSCAKVVVYHRSQGSEHSALEG